ncbi:MAG: hypothetical protein DK302_000442 [Chloroflexi bacterium]|nr:MAG: hypothetical protein DK302_000442 [Chloroflexota bacterium]
MKNMKLRHLSLLRESWTSSFLGIVWVVLIFAFYFFYKFEEIWPTLKDILKGV